MLVPNSFLPYRRRRVALMMCSYDDDVLTVDASSYHKIRGAAADAWLTRVSHQTIHITKS